MTSNILVEMYETMLKLQKLKEGESITLSYRETRHIGNYILYLQNVMMSKVGEEEVSMIGPNGIKCDLSIKKENIC